MWNFISSVHVIRLVSKVQRVALWKDKPYVSDSLVLARLGNVSTLWYYSLHLEQYL